jgi:hypothetical protein
MGADDVFPAEMPDHPSHPPVPTVVPLDDDTAERLLAGRLHPEDAPPGYAEVARLLRAAAGPASPDELADQEAALAAFRVARSGPGQGRAEHDLTPVRLRRHLARFRPRRRHAPFRLWRGPSAVGAGRGRAPARARLAALALAGTLVAGGAWIGGGVRLGDGVWTADGALTALGLRSTSGGPGTGGPGFAAPGPGAGSPPGSGAAGGPGSLRPVTRGRAPALPSASDRATARHGRGVTSRGGGSPHGVEPGGHAKPPKAKPPKAGRDKPGKDRSGESKPAPGKAPKAKAPKYEPGEAKPPKANPAPVENRGHG